ncbi:MAG: hypothetical protein LBD05_02760 [Mycoplasmataceae bacterium]|jgi:hypothetical protein|nr:hypothetical protein [Mycoplasmataceae bacterium]
MSSRIFFKKTIWKIHFLFLIKTIILLIGIAWNIVLLLKWNDVIGDLFTQLISAAVSVFWIIDLLLLIYIWKLSRKYERTKQINIMISIALLINLYINISTHIISSNDNTFILSISNFVLSIFAIVLVIFANFESKKIFKDEQ